MASPAVKQDLPPQGGYRKLDFSRVPAKAIWNWWSIIPAYIGCTAVGYYLWRATDNEIKAQRLENYSATFAMMPLIIAEKDRLFLKQLRKNREDEAELMKNVEGWEVGTLYGEKIYSTLPDDELKVPILPEYFNHSPPTKHMDVQNFFHWF